ncbi:hypothetical protein T440DRAFT_403528, partial [Plenodomus tracheiphilus IPT5]
GCVTCKSRRVKCDETKPSCQQCEKRRIPCGGFKIDVRWKQAPDLSKQSPPRRNRGVSISKARPQTSKTPRASASGHATIQDELGVQTMHADGLQAQHRLLSSDLPAAFSQDLSQPDYATGDAVSDPSEILMPDFDETPAPSSLDHDPHGIANAPSSDDHLFPSVSTEVPPIDFTPDLWNLDSFWEDYLRPVDAPLDFEGALVGQDAGSELLKARDEEAERIALLFHQQTCCTLSIQEESEQNPWRTMIWPLAKEYPALWYALAALTSLCMSKHHPQYHNEYPRHVRRCTELLGEGLESDSANLDAALAATLALGLAETWNYGSPSAGMVQIRNAGELLSRILSSQPSMARSSDEESRTEFLYNTWTYMDVLARFTCNDAFPSYSTSSPIPHWSQLGWSTARLDPLMGYSTTFFPIMRRVADLINKVRARSTPRNSPAIISQALQLRRVMEDWSPPVDLEALDDPTPNMTDAIQTAEAYRWATLCLLYQAVPELPNLTSYGELAQKVLVYLATIAPNSPTIIVHILPLMVAGCDAVEEEDREFVRDRWSAMAERMVTGIIDRCLKITEEVWKRREVYLFARGLSVTRRDIRLDPTTNDTTALSNDIASFINFGTSPANQRNTSRTTSFPISAAFKKGVDTLTRSGCNDYTVRGKLHWLGVMKDWDMQGDEYACSAFCAANKSYSHVRLRHIIRTLGSCRLSPFSLAL